MVALFAEQYVAVPEEFGGAEFILFVDAAAQGIVGVGGGLGNAPGTGFFYCDQLVLAVVVVAGAQCAACAAAFFNQVAAIIVGKVAIAMKGQAVAGGFGGLAGLGAVLGAEDVACETEAPTRRSY